MRLQLRPLRRCGSKISRPRARRPRRAEGLRHLQSARRRARGNALELPVLAGLPLRRPGADGRQRRRAEARQQRARLARSPSKSVFREAGFPEDLFRTAARPEPRRAGADRGSGIGRGDPHWQRRAPGRSVAAAAGAVLKKCVLELGGSDAYLVLEDADIARPRQVCADRPHGERRPELHRRQALHRRRRGARCVRAGAASSKCARYAMGDPRGGGHQARAAAERRPRATRSTSRSRRASRAARRLLLGGEVPDRPGAWYPATVLAGVRPGSPRL